MLVYSNVKIRGVEFFAIKCNRVPLYHGTMVY
jgi:hypothetical protein